MKKILMLTAFALAGLAAAQDTTTTDTSTTTETSTETTTDTTTDTGTTTETTTETSTDTSTETTDTTTDTATETTTDAGTETETTTDTATDAGTGTEAGAASPATMSATDNFARAQEFAVQADVAYPVPFYDRTLWKASVDSAYYAASMETGNRDYQAYLAQLYTKTQWWINAYNAWTRLGELNDTEKQWASLSAAKLAYLALQRGDKATASTYVEKGLSWADSPSLQAIKSRL